jgi:hypothetical protein
MANAIRYSTTGDTQSLKKGNFFFGVGDVGKGPSSATTYYNGSTPVASGYTIYSYDVTQTSRISYASPTTDSEFIRITNAKSGQNFTGVTQCLNWYATQTNYVAVNKDYEPIVSDGLVLNLDASYTPSYTSSGTTWYDLGYSGNNGTLTNGPTFSSANGGSIVFDGVDDYADLGNNASVQINQGTISAWVRTSAPGSSFRGIITKQNNYGLFTSDGVLVTYDWGNVITRTTGINIADGTWKNVAMTFTNNVGTPSNNAIIYLNGTAILTSTIKFVNNLIEVQLASGGTNNATPTGTRGIQQLNGNISQSLIYNRALSATEVLQNFNAQKSRFGL